MKLLVDPLTAPPDVDAVVPGSKSITNRALICAALADGASSLSGALFAADTVAMMDCVEALGATVARDRSSARVDIVGVAGRPTAPSEPLFVNQSGTTARFIMPMAALADGAVTIDAHEQMRGRPQGELYEALATMGARVEAVADPGHLPARVIGGPLAATHIDVAADTSSQFVSALLLTAPALDHELTIELSGTVISRPYLDMTVAVMRSFGAQVDVDAADASSASYFFAAAAVSRGRVAIDGLGTASLQGDAAFVEVLQAMGAEVDRAPHRTEVRGTATLAGGTFSMEHISDTAPTLGAIAPLADGAVEVTNVEFIRHKESDRIAGVVNELARLGVEVSESDDGFVVTPGPVSGAVVQTYDDHRMAMAFTILGLVAPGIEIDDPGCVAKTFPEFFDAVDQLRAAGDAELAVLAIDGPAGSGKSTVARLVAERLGLRYLDTGAMYRSVTYAALGRDIDVHDGPAVSDLARHLEIDVALDHVIVDGADATTQIRSAAVNAGVSPVATHPGVRAAMRRQQRAWARRLGGGVLEGRDIGSVVFPNAKLKVYVTASPEERARRRTAEAGRPYAEILAEIMERDRIDSGRADSPLTEADDAVVIDTTDLTIDEVVDRIAEMFDA